jgi:hypothetical protein
MRSHSLPDDLRHDSIGRDIPCTSSAASPLARSVVIYSRRGARCQNTRSRSSVPVPRARCDAISNDTYAAQIRAVDSE